MKQEYAFTDLETGEVVQLKLSFDELMSMDARRCIEHKGRRYQRFI